MINVKFVCAAIPPCNRWQLSQSYGAKLQIGSAGGPAHPGSNSILVEDTSKVAALKRVKFFLQTGLWSIICWDVAQGVASK